MIKLLPTVADVILGIANLSDDISVRITGQESNDYTPAQAVKFFDRHNIYNIEVQQVDQKQIILNFKHTHDNQHMITISFYKKTLSQIGIKSL